MRQSGLVVTEGAS
jgi:hypothetical protein